MPTQSDSSINLDRLRAQLDDILNAPETESVEVSSEPTRVQPQMPKSIVNNVYAISRLTEEAKIRSPEQNDERVKQMATYGEYVSSLRRREMVEGKPRKASLLNKTKELLVGANNVLLGSKVTERDLIQRESRIGGELFGTVPANHHRQFFNLEPAVWVWYEEWMDGKNKPQNRTTRYEVHENGVLKVQDNAPYYYIEGQELNNLLLATRMYYERVAQEIYHVNPVTGKAQTA